MTCPFLQYFSILYQYIFLQYYMLIPTIYNGINSIIININHLLKNIHLPIHVPSIIYESELSNYSSTEIEIKLVNKDDSIYPIFYRHMVLFSSCIALLTLFSSMGMLFCRSMLLIFYPLYETVSTMDNLQKKNEWLSYWIFYIVYSQFGFLLEYLFWNDILELCTMYIVIRYQFLKSYIFHLLLYMNNNKDKSVADVFEVQKLKIKNNWNLLISKVNT